jgi:phosphonate metabolism protein (transferase hexapeptide repeat family)
MLLQWVKLDNAVTLASDSWSYKVHVSRSNATDVIDYAVEGERKGRYADIANADIGKFANIAAFSRIGATDHPFQTAACHHFLYRSEDYWDDAGRDEAFFTHRKSRRAVIGHDTWIGAGAMVKPKVTLGHGAVVAAGAVVTKNVAPYTIVAGTPATPLRLRQPRDIAERLIALAWWDWSHDSLRTALQIFGV